MLLILIIILLLFGGGGWYGYSTYPAQRGPISLIWLILLILLIFWLLGGVGLGHHIYVR